MMKFQPGRIVATPGAIDAIARANQTIERYLERHLSGDWGDVGAGDWEANDWSLEHGERLLSSYRLPDDTTIWIITERDRSATTALLPEEY